MRPCMLICRRALLGRFLLGRSQQGKQNDLANGLGIGQQHDQPIDTYPQPTGGRHSMLQSHEKILVQLLVLAPGLVFEPRPLFGGQLVFVGSLLDDPSA